MLCMTSVWDLRWSELVNSEEMGVVASGCWTMIDSRMGLPFWAVASREFLCREAMQCLGVPTILCTSPGDNWEICHSRRVFWVADDVPELPNFLFLETMKCQFNSFFLWTMQWQPQGSIWLNLSYVLVHSKCTLGEERKWILKMWGLWLDMPSDITSCTLKIWLQVRACRSTRAMVIGMWWILQ